MIINIPKIIQFNLDIATTDFLSTYLPKSSDVLTYYEISNNFTTSSEKFIK